jgi:alkylation response protein AidB-like acyl-CoA dehydrogenase
MTAAPEWGGQGLPGGFSLAFGEMLVSGNMAWRMYSGLSESAALTIAAHGSEALKQAYLPKMVAGEWSGTMCLTEAHSGTDLGILKTKAEPQADGSYAITGTKIFISAGEHDLTEEHRSPGAGAPARRPPGHKGISLFVVPKVLPERGRRLGRAQRRPVRLDRAQDGHPRLAHLRHALQRLDRLAARQAERGPRLHVHDDEPRAARRRPAGPWPVRAGLAGIDRLRQRPAAGSGNADRAKEPGKAADPIIVHPDVRRMLFTQKAFVEGGRVLCFLTGREIDSSHLNPDPAARKRSADLIAFLTPIVKGVPDRCAMEVTSLAVQIHGGHGFIRETGVEQLMRDARITPIYEGTNGIQALDLLGRKVFGTGGKSQQMISARIVEAIQKFGALPEIAPLAADLGKRLEQWGKLTAELGLAAMKNPDEVGAAATDYLHVAGYVCLGWCWLAAAGVAARKLAEGDRSADFYKAKLVTASHYFDRILPRVDSHAAAARAARRG